MAGGIWGIIDVSSLGGRFGWTLVWIGVGLGGRRVDVLWTCEWNIRGNGGVEGSGEVSPNRQLATYTSDFPP